MVLDFRDVKHGTRLETDLCIVGAGAAGITIARELIGSGINIYLVESGGFDYDFSNQLLYKGEQAGLPYYQLQFTRLRFFGGTTNHWVGLCAPRNEIDFEARPWVPYSGWPISRADLDSYYKRAHPILNLGSYVYDQRVWRLLGIEPLRFNPDKIQTAIWKFSDPVARLGKKYRQEIEQAENIRLLLNANVTNIQTNETGSIVDYVDIATIDGKRATLQAKRFILACGGLENPRLFLLSNTVASTGIGNQHDLVGRFFMEHLHANVGELLSDDYAGLLDTYLKNTQRGRNYLLGLRLGEETQRQEQVLNSAVEIKMIAKADSGVQTAKDLYNRFRRGEKIDDLPDAIWRIVKDLDDVAYNAYRRLVQGKVVLPPVEKVNLFSFGEQSPNPDSRVVLSDEKDALGMNRIKLAWRVTELDRRSIETLEKVIGTELGRLNTGRVRIYDWLLKDSDTWGENLYGGNHHMGTTRMADSPKFGVVDRNCRVHGVSNLYLAGSSVFATGGYANPTLTIVALALRLADHLKSQLV